MQMFDGFTVFTVVLLYENISQDNIQMLKKQLAWFLDGFNLIC